MDQTNSKVCWRADSPSTSSGRLSETSTVHHGLGKLVQGTYDNSEMTLMKLRRLSIRLMSKNERLRYSERKLCRSNVFKFLDSHLTHSSEKVRYLTLEVLCYTVPRLGNKTNKLLKPIMPRVIQCLQGDEEKDIKLKGLHFLRGYFRHTRYLLGFIENFVRLGIENKDPEIRISCFYGLNIIFDQDIGNSLFSPLVISIANQLSKNNRPDVIRAGYRALKCIHETIGDGRFFGMMSGVNPEAIHIYRDFFAFEESDSFLSVRGNDCSTLVSAYQIKRRNLNLHQDFGIMDPNLLDQIERTRNCERAKAVANFSSALRRTLWTDADLDTHILDFLKLVIGFIGDSNRLIQMSGFDILKEVINRMGFILSPHIRCIVKILLDTLTSANSKIKSKSERVLHKLMRNIHPMTVMWELLETGNSHQKEAVLIFVQEKIKCFPYHELDMVALCSYLGQSLEDKNLNVAKYSRDCISLLLDIMRDCPSYGNRSEAVRVLLRNYNLSRDTLKDIGILGHSEEDYLESFESYSEDETTELVMENAFLEHSEASSGSEDGIGETASVQSRCCTAGVRNNLETAAITKLWKDLTTPELSDNPSRMKLGLKDTRDFLKSFKIRRLASAENSASQENFLNQNQEGGMTFISSSTMPGTANGSQNMNFDKKQKRKCLTCFCMKTESTQSHKDWLQDIRASGDSELHINHNELNSQKEAVEEFQKRLVIESYEQDGVQIDVMNKDMFNFNIMEVENDRTTDGLEEIDESDVPECEEMLTSSPKDEKKLKFMQVEKFEIIGNNKNLQQSDIFSNILPLTPYDCVTPLTADENIESEFPSKEISPLVYEACNYSKIEDENMIKQLKERTEERLIKHTDSKELTEGVSDTESLSIEHENCSLQQVVDILGEVKRKVNVANGDNIRENNISDDNSKKEEMEPIVEEPAIYPTELDENETPFLPKSRQLPRTPVKKKVYGLEAMPRSAKNRKRYVVTSKRKKAEEKNRESIANSILGSENQSKRSDKMSLKSRDNSLNQNGRDGTVRQLSTSKHNSPSNWGGCQWRRDLDYAAKGATCSWAENFEELVGSMQPFPSSDVAESEMKKAIEDLYGSSWLEKEDAMLKVIRLAKHHPEMVYDNTSKIAVALSNEIRNFRQSVAGKAILTTGHLYEIMGKHFENKLRLIVAALLAKSGNRTLAAYYRLVIRCLAKITDSAAPQKVVLAFIHEGSRHANKAARETAAQFLSILTESLGPENSMATPLCGHMIKCAATFVLDSSALTRYCGKRMFGIFMKHPEFEKLKDHHLAINTVQSLSRILEQIKNKGVGNEILPINIIE